MLLAKARVGELLAAMPKAEGAMGIGKAPDKCGSREEPHSTPTLADHGIKKKQSMNWQALARLPEELGTVPSSPAPRPGAWSTG